MGAAAFARTVLHGRTSFLRRGFRGNNRQDEIDQVCQCFVVVYDGEEHLQNFRFGEVLEEQMLLLVAGVATVLTLIHKRGLQRH